MPGRDRSISSIRKHYSRTHAVFRIKTARRCDRRRHAHRPRESWGPALSMMPYDFVSSSVDSTTYLRMRRTLPIAVISSSRPGWTWRRSVWISAQQYGKASMASFGIRYQDHGTTPPDSQATVKSVIRKQPSNKANDVGEKSEQSHVELQGTTSFRRPNSWSVARALSICAQSVATSCTSPDYLDLCLDDTCFGVPFVPRHSSLHSSAWYLASGARSRPKVSFDFTGITG